MSALIRYPIRLKSALGTPLKSDTLSGQILCAYREKHGEKELETLLEGILLGELPFRISDAFPSGCLPLPFFPPIPRRLFRSLAEQRCSGDRFEALQLQKDRRRSMKYIPQRIWVDLRSNASLYSLLQDCLLDAPKQSWTAVNAIEMHNVIDRNLNKTLKSGGIFTVENTWMGARYGADKGTGIEESTLDLYASIRQDFLSEFEDLLKRIGNTGFGRDASVGLGHFEVLEREEAADLLDCNGANRWLNLSTISTTEGAELGSGYCQMRAKFGKVWSGFGENAPFKKPILVADPGAIVRNPPREASMILRGVHPTNPKIIQYNAGVFLPFVLNERPDS